MPPDFFNHLKILKMKKLAMSPIYMMGRKHKKNEEEEYEVKSIKLVTPLDDGSANDGTGINIQKGMVYGKNYTFIVSEYMGNRPKLLRDIKWELTYHDLDDNEWKTLPISNRGETCTINMANEDTCGRFVYIRAYINDKKNSAQIKVWKHNRFRWFDRLVVTREIEERIISPWKINQSNTSLCGMACIFYLFAKEQPEKYRKFCLDLFRKGIVTCNSYTAKPTNDILNKKAKKIKLKGDKFKIVAEGNTNLSLVDFITLAGVRNSENNRYKGGEEEFEAINWTPIITNLCEKLLGYGEVKSKGAYNPIKPFTGYSQIEITNKINDINEQLKNDYHLIWMIDSDLIDDVWDYESADLHWVVLESEVNGELQYLNGNGEIEYMVDFKVYSWGTNPFDRRDKIKDEKGNEISNPDKGFLKKPITRNHFMNNYNGYIKVKNI